MALQLEVLRAWMGHCGHPCPGWRAQWIFQNIVSLSSLCWWCSCRNCWICLSFFGARNFLWSVAHLLLQSLIALFGSHPKTPTSVRVCKAASASLIASSSSTCSYKYGTHPHNLWSFQLKMRSFISVIHWNKHQPNLTFPVRLIGCSGVLELKWASQGNFQFLSFSILRTVENKKS